MEESIGLRYAKKTVVTGTRELEEFKSTRDVLRVEDAGNVSEEDVMSQMNKWRSELILSGLLVVIFAPIGLIGFFWGARSTADLGTGMILELIGVGVSILALIRFVDSLYFFRKLKSSIGQPKYRVYYNRPSPVRTHLPPGMSGYSEPFPSGGSDYERRRQEREVRAREFHKRVYSGSSPYRRRRHR